MIHKNKNNVHSNNQHHMTGFKVKKEILKFNY